jgi:2-keto-4-pentenoate hydratase/2-oxohepta-3-ene-1,7-dioic acid hydratase in catechol pathway
MRLLAYRDRYDCDRFGVDVDGSLLTGSALERRGNLARSSTHLAMEALFVDDDWRDRLGKATRRALERGARPIPVADRRAAAPFARPGKVVCVGLNYQEHAAEGGRAAPDHPLLFAKFANAIIADGEPVVRPPGTHALDLEVELGVVIGRTAQRVDEADALDHVAGYLVVNDISARDWQGNPQALRDGQKGDGQWLRAKGSDTFLPMGQAFVTADELDPRDGLRLRSWRITADGEEHPMQDGTTRDLIWDVPALIAFISRHITLDPGDVIATGTPSGVGVFRDPPVFLEPGGRVRCEIEGIGTVENPIVDGSGPEAEAPTAA